MIKAILFLAASCFAHLCFADVVKCKITDKVGDTASLQQTVVIKLDGSKNKNYDLTGEAYTKYKFEKISAYTRFETFASLQYGKPVQRGWEVFGVKIQSVNENEGDVNLRFSVLGERQTGQPLVLQLNENYTAVCNFIEQ